MNKNWVKYSILSILMLILISLVLSIWFPIWESFRIVFGSVYLLFLPGFVWSWVFWKKNKIDFIERIILSFALSIALTPLTAFLFNKISIRINLCNTIIEILGVIIIGIIFWIINKNSLANNENKK